MARCKADEWLTPEGLMKIEGWARDGLTEEQIAHNMGIARSTLSEWKNKFKDISDTLKKGKEVIDLQVENALLKRALGYSYTEITKERIVDNGQKKRHSGNVELTEKEWEFAIKYFGHKCAYCGKPTMKLERDHLHPLIKGGELSRNNVVPSCRSCNASKKDNDVDEWYPSQPYYDVCRAEKIKDYFAFIDSLESFFEEQSAEMVVTKEVTKEVLPDVTAQIFWLKNRKPESWREKQEIKVSGTVNNPYEGLTTEELKKLIGDE